MACVSLTTLCFAAAAALLCGGAGAVQWSSSFPDGTSVDACTKNEVTFPWEITLGVGESISDTQWFFSGHSQEMIASFTHGYFLTTPPYSNRAEHISTIGLQLRDVTDGDSGNYSVEVMVRDSAGSVTTIRHTAVLLVISGSEAIRDVSVTTRQEPLAVYDNQTGQYHVHLTCSSQGRTPSSVIWTLPSGSTKTVSTNTNGRFSLLVPNPVAGGNYTCSVHPSSTAASCAPAGSKALQGDSVYVDKAEARFALLEAEQQDLRKKNAQLSGKVNELETSMQTVQTENTQLSSSLRTLQTENSQLSSSVHTLQTENSHLSSTVTQLSSSVRLLQTENEHLKHASNERVAFHAAGVSTSHSVNGSRIIFSTAEYNLGNCYSSSTGYFTAPYSGVYAFFVTTNPGGDSRRANIYLYKTPGVPALNEIYSFTNGDTAASNAVTHLNAGERVWVVSQGEGYFSPFGTAFSGFLLYPDA